MLFRADGRFSTHSRHPIGFRADSRMSQQRLATVTFIARRERLAGPARPTNSISAPIGSAAVERAVRSSQGRCGHRRQPSQFPRPSRQRIR